MDDWQLLNEYVETGSEAAFRSLVERHINLVHSVAMRHVRDADRAREVSQAVFILLARKATSFRRSVVLSAWLYRTARFVAARAVRSEQRRVRREQEAVRMQTLNYSPETVSRLAPVLDDALDALSEKDRQSLLLRFYEEQSLGQVGGRLGISEEAAKKRVSRALEKLRAAFARRGFGVSVAVVGALLSERIAEAAPASLANGVTSVALSATSTTLPVLVQQAVQAWRWAKIKIAVGIGAAVIAVFFVIHETAPRNSVATRSDTVASIATPDVSALSTPVAATMPRNARVGRPFLFKVVDAETGAGIASAEIHARYWSGPDVQPRDDLFTDDDGVCGVPLPDGELGRLDLGIVAPGYVQKFFTWWPGHFGPLPRSYTFKVERGVSIGGFVRDPGGRPVVEAEIILKFPFTGESDSRERKSERLGFFDDLPVTRTDAKGHWQCANVPPRYTDFSISVKHSDFPNRWFNIRSDNETSGEGLSIADLYAGNAVLTLRPGLTLTGLVEDEHGKPIAGAAVCISRWADPERPATVTDASGKFRVTKLAGAVRITVFADGYAPERSANVDPSQTPIRIQLKPASVLRVRVVDSTGQPVPEADVAIEEWLEHGTVQLRKPTDSSGIFEWRSAPADPMKIDVLKPGYLTSRDNEVQPNGQDQVITLKRQFRVIGRVVDAETGEPLANFKVTPGYGSLPHWDVGETTYGRDGQYDLSFSEDRPPYSVRISAEGYTAADSTPISDDHNPQNCDFELRHGDPRRAIKGTVLLPNGRPAAYFEVALCTIDKGVCIGRGRVARNSSARPIQTDEQGAFEFPLDPNAHTLIAVGPEGIGRARLQGDDKPLQIRLQPWGRISGTVQLASGRAGKRVQLMDDAIWQYGGGTSLDFDFAATSDAEGRFVIEQAPPGDFDLHIVPDGAPYQHRTPISVKAGQTVQVQIGGSGLMINGRFDLADASMEINWSNQIGFLTFQTSKAPPEPPHGLDRTGVEKWKREFWESTRGRAFARSQSAIALQIGRDGTFVAENVKPGEYELTVQLYDRVGDRSGANWLRGSKLLGSINRKKITIPESSRDEPFALGTIVLTPSGYHQASH